MRFVEGDHETVELSAGLADRRSASRFAITRASSSVVVLMPASAGSSSRFR